MTNREELIEEAAKAIVEVEYPEIAWGLLSEARKEFRRRQARAALAVFENALTPTDDEREALIDKQPETIIERVLDDAGYDLFQPWRTGVVNAISAWVNETGRAVEPQGEPSDAQAEALKVLEEVEPLAAVLGNLTAFGRAVIALRRLVDERAALRAAWEAR